MILPPDAQVEVNGESRKAVGGYLDLEGKLGTEFAVKLSKGNYKKEVLVALVESGAFPPMINLVESTGGTSKKSATTKTEPKRDF